MFKRSLFIIGLVSGLVINHQPHFLVRIKNTSSPYIILAQNPSTTINTINEKNKVKESYQQFSNSLELLINQLKKVSNSEIEARYITVKPQIKIIEKLKEDVENLQSNNNSMEIVTEIKNRQALTIINELEEVLRNFDQGLDFDNFVRFKEYIDIEDKEGNYKEQRFNYLITYLQQQNQLLAVSLNQSSKDDSLSYLLIVLLIFLFITLILLIGFYLINSNRKSNKSRTDLLELDENENIPQFIEKIKKSIQSSNTANQFDKNSEEIKQSLQEIIKLISKESASSSSKKTEIDISKETKSRPNNNKDRFIPLYEEFVNDYNENDDIDIYKPIRVSQSLGENTEPLCRFSHRKNGHYNIIEFQNSSYLVPLPNLVINEHHKTKLVALFYCFPANSSSDSQRFKLLKPAEVFFMGDEWKLKEKGVLQFE